MSQLRDFLLTIDLVVGTGFAAREGVSFDPVPPAAQESGEHRAGPTDEQIADATERARQEDGTVDAFALAEYLGDLADPDPAPPRSDDPHFRFHGDPQMMRAIRGNG